MQLQKTDELIDLDPATLIPKLNPILVTDGVGLEQVRKYLSTPRPYSLDYESQVTKGFYRRRGRVMQIGDLDVQYIIDLLAIAGDTRRLIHGQGGFRAASSPFHIDGQIRMYNEEETEFELAPVDTSVFKHLVDVVRPSFESDEYLKIGYNLEFEYVLSRWAFGMRLWHLNDLFHGERLRYNGIVDPQIRGFWGLSDAVGRYLKVKMSKEEQKSFDLHSPLVDNQIIYAALDLYLPWQVKPKQDTEISRVFLDWAFQIENNATPPFGDMHIWGMKPNDEKWEQIIFDNEEELKQEIANNDNQFIPIVGSKIYPPAPEDVAAAHAFFKAHDKPGPDELQITALSKHFVGKLGKQFADVKAALAARRAELQTERVNNKPAAKEAYEVLRKYDTKKYRDEFGKYEGEAAINYGSWQQVLNALHSEIAVDVLIRQFDERQDKLPDNRKDGIYRFDAKVLPNLNAKTTLLKFMGMPIIKHYNRYRKIGKQLSTYGYRWITPNNVIAKDSEKYGFLDPDTLRIHPRFLQLGTDTGRPSCIDPNVLNLPSRDGRFKEAFRARHGNKCVCRDCSGQELRILTDYSHEPLWVDAFRTGKDVHSMSTRMFRATQWNNGADPGCKFFDGTFKKCKCKVHKPLRERYKAVTLGVIMGKQKWSLATEMEIDPEEADGYISEWFNTFQHNKAAIDHNQESAYEAGEARTRSGRRRLVRKPTQNDILKKVTEKYGDKFTNENNQDKKDKIWDRVKDGMVAAIKREAGNVPYQGTGADLMKTAMGCGFDANGVPFLWHILNALEDEYGIGSVQLQNYVYDEFLAETLEMLAETVSNSIEDVIIRAGAEFVTVVPMESEGGVADYWTKD